MSYQLDIDGGAKKVTEILGKLPPNLSSSSSVVESVKRKLFQYSARAFFAGQKKAIGQIQDRTQHIKEMCGMVDLFLSPSKFLITKFKEFGIPEEKMIFSDYGFDILPFANFKRTESKKIRFGYVGSIIPTKGIHVLIEALNKIADARAGLVIWGKDVGYDGVNNYSEYLKGIVKNPAIRFAGEYDNKKIAEVLADIDVLIVPSIWYENSPLTIHEAFLAKTPLIVSGIGGMAELVKDGVNGLHFCMGDARDLAAKIISILDNPSLISELAKNASEVKTIQENAEEITQFYASLTGRLQ
jgi:glycosyltransferase involved in cell wall biosynthesis